MSHPPKDSAGRPKITTLDDAPTFATALSAAITAQRLSLDRIRNRLTAAGAPISIATLSYWQSGRSLPTRASSLRVVGALETVLGLDPGALTSLVTDERRRRQVADTDWETVIPASELAARDIAELGFRLPDAELTRESVHDVLTINSDGTEAHQRTRLVLRAAYAGAQRWPVVLEQDAEQGVVPEVTALSGCSVGRTIARPDYNLVVAEMCLPRPLERGELALVDYLATFGPTEQVSFRMERSCITPVRELVLEARFPADAHPETVVAFSRPQMEDAADTGLEEVELCEGRAQLIRHDLDRGIYGLRWSWPGSAADRSPARTPVDWPA